jgi:hypothetical protein
MVPPRCPGGSHRVRAGSITVSAGEEHEMELMHRDDCGPALKYGLDYLHEAAVLPSRPITGDHTLRPSVTGQRSC